MSGVPFFARRFVAGTRDMEAIEVGRRLNADRIATSLDILGENVADEAAARRAAAAYVDLVRTIRKSNINSNISIKATMLGLDVADALAEELLTELLEAAREAQMFVRIDMEGSPYTQRTVDLFLKMRARFDNVGIVLQAYLHRTAEDLARVLDAGGRVRLCKGAYKEPPKLAIQNMAEIRKNFLKLSEMLVERGDYPAFATHDDHLIEPIKTLAARRDKATFEFQMLYGLRRRTWHRMVEEGYNFRVYVPFGVTWFPYFSRRLRERKENVLFVLKNLFRS